MKTVFVTYVNFCLGKREHYTLDYGTIRQELEKYPVLNLEILRRVIIDIRQSKLPDPKVLGNAGSFFMNPIVPRRQFESLQREYPDMPHYDVDAGRVKIPAAWMIDRCGWKGADIVALSDAVRASVREKFGIDIHPEVCLIK